MAAFWTWLNTPPAYDQVLGPFGAVFPLVFALGFVASAWLNGPGAAQIGRNEAQVAGLSHWSHVGLWIFGPGLFFFGVGALQINPLSFGEPIWLVGSVIALLIAGFRCVHWWRTVYPQALAAAPVPLPQDRAPNGSWAEADAEASTTAIAHPPTARSVRH